MYRIVPTVGTVLYSTDCFTDEKYYTHVQYSCTVLDLGSYYGILYIEDTINKKLTKYTLAFRLQQPVAY